MVCALVAVVTIACIEPTRPVVIGVNGGNGGSSSGAAPVLSFVAQPNTAPVGQTLPLVAVAASDSLGSLDTTFTGVIQLTLGLNSTGAGLAGTTAVRASSGIATFDDLAVDRAGAYTLRASSTGAQSVTSSLFFISTTTGP